jgi:hypothetical protein
MRSPGLSEETHTRVLGTKRSRAERKAHYSLHVWLVSAPPILLVPVVAWMVWRLSQEGWIAVGLMVVAPVLAALLILAARCMIVIALEGLKERRKELYLGETRAQREVVSVSAWVVRPGPSITALERPGASPQSGVSPSPSGS